MGSAIIKKAPRGGGFYMAKQSFPSGVTPEHLEKYTSQTRAIAQECAAKTKDLKGNARVEAMNGCFAMKRRGK